MKIIFIGTTEFGIPTLEKLSAKGGPASGGKSSQHELVLVITQPDKLAGRKKELTPPPIKLWAEKNNIPVIQPHKILESRFQILDSNPDLIIVAAYGQILPNEILDIPKYKSINIHGSLLPKYRGASPIQSAILNNDTLTGISLIEMDEKMDHGPIIATAGLRLNGDETYPMLYKKLSDLAAELVSKTLPDWFAGKLKPYEQNHDLATFTKLITRADAKIDWSKPAKEIDAQIRALNPEPGTWTTTEGKNVKILKATIANNHKIELPGKIYWLDGKLAVKTLDNGLVIEQIQTEGKNVMSGKDFLNGLKSGSRLFI